MQKKWIDYLRYKVDMERGNGYDNLFEQLYSYEFESINQFDDNRISNVVDMQIEFAEGLGIDDAIFDEHFISVFEVLAVMCIKAEEEMMSNPRYGDRTARWFWSIMKTLDLDLYSDLVWETIHGDYIDHSFEIEIIISKLLNREYNYDGSDGGAFVLRHPRADLRYVDLWYQFMWWLTENYPDEA